jgi:hypothetical protein
MISGPVNILENAVFKILPQETQPDRVETEVIRPDESRTFLRMYGWTLAYAN